MKAIKDWFLWHSLDLPSRNTKTSDPKRITLVVPLLVLFVLSDTTAVQAQPTSTWVAGATSNWLWSKNGNWSPMGAIPNSNSAIAIFGPAAAPTKPPPPPTPPFPPFSVFVDLGTPGSPPVNVGRIQFVDSPTLGKSPAFTITVDAGQHLAVKLGIDNLSVTPQNFVNNGILSFDMNATAGITAASNKVSITNNSILNFTDGSNAGNATITTSKGGSTFFKGHSSGATASFITMPGGLFDISGLDTNTPGTTAGSIAGAGTYNLGSKELSVGSNGLSTTVSGLIEGNGGSLIKVGTGTLTLLGDNTYSGGTIVEEGTLVAGTPNAAIETSTALGTGNASVQGGTLRTTSFQTSVPLTIHVGGNYTQGPGGTLALGIGGLQGEQYDHVQVNGSASLGGTLAVSSLNGFRPADKNFFEVVSV